MKKLLISLTILFCFQAPGHASLHDLIDPVVWKKNLKEQLDRTNINFSVGFSEGSLINGVPVGLQYGYKVSPSYLPHSYNRIDRYDINFDVGIGSMVKALSDTPLSFSLSRHQSLFFVRQFHQKLNAISAIPYSPNRLPITAERALNKLEVGDFASIPANLSLAISAGASTSLVNPLVINTGVNAYWIISGEFNIQIYKLDEKHVRLKMITTRAYTRGTSSNTEASFSVIGLGILGDPVRRQLDRLYDRDMIQLGMAANRGSQFILDYVFDLTDPAAAEAYNEILSSSFKFKDIVIMKNFGEEKEIRNKLFSTYEKADRLYLEDSKLLTANQRVRRLFKGFTDSTSRTKHLKLGLFLTNYTDDRTFSSSDLSFTDDNEKETEFWYPTYTHYSSSLLGNFLWGYEDIQDVTCFGLLPKQNDLKGQKIPEIGINFDRTDAVLTPHEQRKLRRIINKQIPNALMQKVDWSNWLAPHNKHASRISFKLIINSEAYPYLRDYSEIDIQNKYLDYAISKKIKHLNQETIIRTLGTKIYTILQNKKNDAEGSIRDLINLNKTRIFAESGVGFLASLLPEEKLKELMYLKLEILALDEKTITLEFGTINHEIIYRELAELQSKIANRSFDLRVPNQSEP